LQFSARGCARSFSRSASQMLRLRQIRIHNTSACFTRRFLIQFARYRMRMKVSKNSRVRCVAGPLLCVLLLFSNIELYAQTNSTFSDANWISMGGICGANGNVLVTAVDAAGNLYIGGDFTIVGDVIANHIAKWDGSRWSALDSGVSAGTNCCP